MKALMSSRPRRGACSEYCSSMSGAASSSTMAALYSLPQKCVNQRPTMALLSSSLDMMLSSYLQLAGASLQAGERRDAPNLAFGINRGEIGDVAQAARR